MSLVRIQSGALGISIWYFESAGSSVVERIRIKLNPTLKAVRDNEVIRQYKARPSDIRTGH